MQVAVLGLGRFGSHLAEMLQEQGHDVLAVDMDAGVVNAVADLVARAMIADITDLGALREIAVGDVAGKGIPAALLVAALRASVFSLANSDLTLRTIVGRTNRLLYETVGETRYATLFYGVLDAPPRAAITSGSSLWRRITKERRKCRGISRRSRAVRRAPPIRPYPTGCASFRNPSAPSGPGCPRPRPGASGNLVKEANLDAYPIPHSARPDRRRFRRGP